VLSLQAEVQALTSEGKDRELRIKEVGGGVEFS
jgi:hypothetical protein